MHGKQTEFNDDEQADAYDPGGQFKLEHAAQVVSFLQKPLLHTKLHSSVYVYDPLGASFAGHAMHCVSAVAPEEHPLEVKPGIHEIKEQSTHCILNKKRDTLYTKKKLKAGLHSMSAPSTACNNPICAQFRIQHKNITLKRLELEKEIDQMRRAQSSQYNQAVEMRSVTPVRDAVTGEMGLMMRNGEVMTPDKIAKRMEIAAKCLETLQASEKHNRQLVEENKYLKQTNETTFNEMRRLERALAGFERTRRFEPFTQEQHKITLELNEQMATDLERLEREMHALQEENAILKQHSRRQTTCAPRTNIEDSDGEEHTSITSYISSDGSIPTKCPCDAIGCEERYDTQVIGSESPTEAFVLHMSRVHKVREVFFAARL